MKAYIKRERLAPGRGKNCRMQWKYLYDVEGLPVVLKGFDMLSSAVRAAKKHGATEIVKRWIGK